MSLNNQTKEEKYKLAKNDKIWVEYIDIKNLPRFLITSNERREIYNLYVIEDGKAIKTNHKKKNPLELYEIAEKLIN